MSRGLGDVYKRQHNLKTALGELLEYTYNPEGHKDVEPTEEAFFEGYMRENGTVGVRNEVWIIPTVGCVNSIARAIEATARANKPEGVDEVVAFPHPYGCSQVTEDQENTRHVLADLINHPNAGAVLVLGLGCENSRIEVLKDYIGEVNPDRVKFLQVQDVENEQEAAEGIMKELMSYAATFKREKVSAKHLIVGMKCGGSDGLSGITANPTVGLFSDMLVSKGGTTILTEVPEMFGAETILMNRCANKELFEKTVHLINDFKEYFIKNGQEPGIHNQIRLLRQQQVPDGQYPQQMTGGVGDIQDVDGLQLAADAADALEGVLHRHVSLEVDELRRHQRARAVVGVFENFIDALARVGVRVL